MERVSISINQSINIYSQQFPEHYIITYYHSQISGTNSIYIRKCCQVLLDIEKVVFQQHIMPSDGNASSINFCLYHLFLN